MRRKKKKKNLFYLLLFYNLWYYILIFIFHLRQSHESNMLQSHWPYANNVYIENRAKVCTALKVLERGGQRGKNINAKKQKKTRFLAWFGWNAYIHGLFYVVFLPWYKFYIDMCAFTLMTEPLLSFCIGLELLMRSWWRILVSMYHRLRTQNEKTDPYYILITG